MVSPCFPVMVSISLHTINFNLEIWVRILSIGIISPSQYILVDMTFLSMRVSLNIPNCPFTVLQSFALNQFLVKLIVHEPAITFPLKLWRIHVPFWRAWSEVFFDSHGRIHFFSLLLHEYPADGIHRWLSRSHPTLIGVSFLSSHAPLVKLVAHFDFAIQELENVCFIGLHGAIIHWTGTLAQTGLYSIVQTYPARSAPYDIVWENAIPRAISVAKRMNFFIKRKESYKSKLPELHT